MISALFVMSKVGDVLISRIFREEVKYAITGVFYTKIVQSDAKGLKNPIVTIGSTSFLYIKKGELYYMAVTRNNSDATVILEYLYSLVDLVTSLITGTPDRILTEVEIMDNVFLLYELLDLTIDQGFVKEIDSKKLLPIVGPSVTKAAAPTADDATPHYELKQCDQELDLLTKEAIDISDNNLELRNIEYLTIDANKKINIQGEIVSVACKDSGEFTLHLHTSMVPPNTSTNTLTLSSLASPKESKDQEKLELTVQINKQIQPILNYALLDVPNALLPVDLYGSYRQISSCKLEINLNLRISPEFIKKMEALNVKIPVPQHTSKISNPGSQDKLGGELQDKSDGYLVWSFTNVCKNVSWQDAENNEIKLCQIIQVGSNCNLSDWVINRGNTLVSYIIRDHNMAGITVRYFDILDEPDMASINTYTNASTSANYSVFV